MRRKEIKCEPDGGEELWKCIRQALRISANEEIDVMFVHNGNKYRSHYNTLLQLIVDSKVVVG